MHGILLEMYYDFLEKFTNLSVFFFADKTFWSFNVFSLVIPNYVGIYYFPAMQSRSVPCLIPDGVCTVGRRHFNRRYSYNEPVCPLPTYAYMHTYVRSLYDTCTRWSHTHVRESKSHRSLRIRRFKPSALQLIAPIIPNIIEHERRGGRIQLNPSLCTGCTKRHAFA